MSGIQILHTCANLMKNLDITNDSINTELAIKTLMKTLQQEKKP